MPQPAVWYGYADWITVTAAIDLDPAADQYYPLFRAPRACELRSAKAMMTDAVAANASNWVKLSLVNGGTAGTATTAISGTAGGTAGWTALLPVDLAVATNAFSAGQVAVLHYDENGTVTPGLPMVVEMTFQMHKGSETIIAEIETAKTAIDTLKTSIDTELDNEDFYLSETVQYMRSLSAELDKVSRRLADDETEAGFRWIDRAV